MINIRNVFSHITLEKGVCNFPDVVYVFFYNLLKFDIVNADIPFYKRGHNLETESPTPFFKSSILEHGCRFSANSKMLVNVLKMLTLICSFILLRRRRKTFYEISMIRC